jgi:hypothetical protein
MIDPNIVDQYRHVHPRRLRPGSRPQGVGERRIDAAAKEIQGRRQRIRARRQATCETVCFLGFPSMQDDLLQQVGRIWIDGKKNLFPFEKEVHESESVQMLWGERRGLWHLRRCSAATDGAPHVATF